MAEKMAAQREASKKGGKDSEGDVEMDW
jgi:hypothetical protein